MINRALEAKPEDMTITMHICRGNFRSTWFSSGGYEPVAETLFGRCHVDGFFLEYDSDRAGGFEPLRFIKDQQVVLGLVTSKTPALEKKKTSSPESGKRKIRTPGPAVPESPVRFLLHRRREPSDGKRTVGQAPADPVHCGKSLGRCVKTGL